VLFDDANMNVEIILYIVLHLGEYLFQIITLIVYMYNILLFDEVEVDEIDDDEVDEM
jgi:hypothetical protein